MAEFIVRYRAIVYRPFKGETVDGVVGNVNKVRIEPFPLSVKDICARDEDTR